MSLVAEKIEDDQTLYKWLPPGKMDLETGRPKPEAFEERDDEEALSTSWAKHCTPQECRARCSRSHRMTVVSLPVGPMRHEPPPVGVTHTPREWVGFERQGLSHTDVRGVKAAKAQFKLATLSAVVLPADPPKQSKSEEVRETRPERREQALLSSKKT